MTFSGRCCRCQWWLRLVACTIAVKGAETAPAAIPALETDGRMDETGMKHSVAVCRCVLCNYGYVYLLSNFLPTVWVGWVCHVCAQNQKEDNHE